MDLNQIEDLLNLSKETKDLIAEQKKNTDIIRNMSTREFAKMRGYSCFEFMKAFRNNEGREFLDKRPLPSIDALKKLKHR